MPDTSQPIAVIDSGLGGLTVVGALRERLPGEDLIYFGDTARVPYGSKSPQTVTTFCRQIIRFLLPKNPKHVLIACNTASALALPTLRREFAPLTISGVIAPGARAAVEACGSKRFPTIGVVATEGTILSKAYEIAISPRRHHARLVLRATPLLVSIVEEGRTLADPLVRLAVAQYLRPMLDRGINVLLLGCTHYPILKPVFVEAAGPNVRVIDSSRACAEDVARRLSMARLLRARDQQLGQGWLRTFVTDNSARFAALAGRFLGFEIEQPTVVPLARLATARSSAKPGNTAHEPADPGWPVAEEEARGQREDRVAGSLGAGSAQAPAAAEAEAA
jgi:glutamate racemase